MNPAHILVVEDSETTLLKLKVVLAYFGYHVTTHSDSTAALDWLTETRQIPDLILSDVLMPGLNGVEFTQKVRANPALAQIPIVLLTAGADAEFEAAGRAAGANEYLNKMLSAVELSNQIKAILDSRQAAAPKEKAPHRMVTVFSPRGGVGTTTIAINLAIALKQLWGGEIALWDMAISTGHCGLMLGLKPEPAQAAWTSRLGEARPAADLLVGHETGIKVILAPPDLALSGTVPENGFDRIWPAVHELADYLVVDGGSHLNGPLQELLRRSDRILAPLSPDVASVKSAGDALEMLEKLGIPPDKCDLVLNNPFTVRQVSKAQINAALGKSPLAEIPYDSQNFARAISTGKPLLVSAPTADASLAVMLLAYQLSKKDMEARLGDYSTPLLHKVRQLEWEVDLGLVKW